jgi:NAD(P)H-dependent flavin oxidoreductase YrpB (nitropropane dioxygenase family)
MGITQLPKLIIGDLEIKLPIIQGGMGAGISMAGLASAVANAGGVGVISSVGLGMFEDDIHTNFKEANIRALRNEIRKAKSMTNGVIGVNIMGALTDYNRHVQISVEEGADMVFLGAGLPLKNPTDFSIDVLKDMPTKIVPKISSARAAKLIFQSWANHYNHVPDAVVVEGPLAGGHLGFKEEQINDPDYALEKLIPEVVETIKPFEEKFNKKIPVIAAGGIYTGADIYKFLNLGATAVKMATRFVATHECDAADEFKQLYIRTKKEDIVIIKSPVGLPGRVIKNKFIEEVTAGVKKPFQCSWKCLKTCDFKKAPYCIAFTLYNAKIGNLAESFAFAGANAYRVDKIMSVKELINELSAEYLEKCKLS